MYVIVNKNPDIAEDDGTYGVGEEVGTWDVVKLVKQSLPVHPLTHVQLSGAVHCLLVPHEKLQIAVL